MSEQNINHESIDQNVSHDNVQHEDSILNETLKLSRQKSIPRVPMLKLTMRKNALSKRRIRANALHYRNLPKSC